MASTGEAVRRHLACGAAVVAAFALAVQFGWTTDYPDRLIAQRASAQLLAGHLDVYARVPEAQMGPLALLLAGLPVGVYIVALSVALYPVLLAAFSAFGIVPRAEHIVSAVLVGAVWHRFPITGHADDVLVLTGAALLMLAKRLGSERLAAITFVVAIAGKPTAVLLLPLVWLVSRRAAVWGVAGAAAVWLPFALADLRGFLSAGSGIVTVFPYSLPAIVGVEPGSPYPWWVRPAQLVIGLALCWWLGRRVGFAAALAATLAARAFLEPGTYPLYWQSIIVAAFFVDLTARWRIPWTTLAALAGWMVTLSYAFRPSEGYARLALLLAVIGLAWLSSSRTVAPTAAATSRSGTSEPSRRLGRPLAGTVGTAARP